MECTMNQTYTKTQKLTIGGVCIALYLVVMFCTQSFAFGQYQVRIATALYGLSYFFPFLVVPFGIANVVSNLFWQLDCSCCCYTASRIRRSRVAVVHIRDSLSCVSCQRTCRAVYFRYIWHDADKGYGKGGYN